MSSEAELLSRARARKELCCSPAVEQEVDPEDTPAVIQRVDRIPVDKHHSKTGLSDPDLRGSAADWGTRNVTGWISARPG